MEMVLTFLKAVFFFILFTLIWAYLLLSPRINGWILGFLILMFAVSLWLIYNTDNLNIK